jgi:nitroreductase
MDLLPELRRRKSPLVFDRRDVDRGKVTALIEAARWAPSCFNNQSWNYVFVHRRHTTRAPLEEALSLGNGWAKKAPYLVVVGADPDEDCKTNDLPYYAYDAGLSVMCLVIEAEHQGLRVHQMAGWNEEQVKNALGFPQNYRVIVVFALGYESDVTSIWNELEERIKDKLVQPRERKPVRNNFFFEALNKDHLSPSE